VHFIRKFQQAKLTRTQSKPNEWKQIVVWMMSKQMQGRHVVRALRVFADLIQEPQFERRPIKQKYPSHR